MKNQILQILIAFCLLLPATSYEQTVQWMNRMGGIDQAINAGPDEMVKDVQADAQGNVYVCGAIRQLANFNGMPVTTYGGQDMFIAKYDCQGNLCWVKTAGGQYDEYLNSFKLDGLGHIYLTGNLTANSLHTVNFFDTIVGANGSIIDMFIAKMDTSGNLMWVNFAAQGTANCSSQAFILQLNSNGEPMVQIAIGDTGVFYQNWIIVNPYLTYIGRFDTSGALIDLQNFYPMNTIGVWAFTINSANDYLFVGQWLKDTVTLAGQTFYNPKPGSTVAFVAKLDSAGVFQWMYRFTDTLPGMTYGGVAFDVAIDNNNLITVSGEVNKGLKCGNFTFTSPPGWPSFSAAFVMKLNQQGQPVWVNQGNSQLGMGFWLANKSNGGVAVSAGVRDSIIVGTDTLYNPGNPSSHSILIAETDANGQWIKADLIQGTGSRTESRCMATDTQDNVFVAGYFDGMLYTGVDTINWQGGYTDGFVLKYGNICTVGLEENTAPAPEGGVLLVYPNPVHSSFSFNYDFSGKSGVGEVKIYNAFGSVVISQQLNNSPSSGRYAVDCSRLIPGIYFLTVNRNGVRVGSGKFVKE